MYMRADGVARARVCKNCSGIYCSGDHCHLRPYCLLHHDGTLILFSDGVCWQC